MENQSSDNKPNNATRHRKSLSDFTNARLSELAQSAGPGWSLSVTTETETTAVFDHENTGLLLEVLEDDDTRKKVVLSLAEFAINRKQEKLSATKAPKTMDTISGASDVGNKQNTASVFLIDELDSVDPDYCEL